KDLNRLAIHQRRAGKLAEALATHDRAIALRRALVLERPADPRYGMDHYRSDLARALASAGDVYSDLGRLAEPPASSRAALQEAGERVRLQPGQASYRADLGDAYIKLGAILTETGRWAEALEPYRRSAETLEALVRDQPNVPAYQYDLARAYAGTG